MEKKPHNCSKVGSVSQGLLLLNTLSEGDLSIQEMFKILKNLENVLLIVETKDT